MLVCMQWTVSGALPAPPGIQLWWRKVGVGDTTANRCGSDVEHVCSRAGGVECVPVVARSCVRAQGVCAILTVRDEGGPLWTPCWVFVSGQGFLHPTPLHIIHGQPCEAGRARTCPLTWPRNPGPEKVVMCPSEARI